MKKIFLLTVVFAAQMNFAQNIFPLPSGNVGIGTTTPTSKLEVKGTIKSYEMIPLAASVNSSQLINERGGNVGENSLFNRLWTYRDLTLNNWYSARLHDGISIDISHNNPQVDTRTYSK